jgi:hypothetical protein
VGKQKLDMELARYVGITALALFAFNNVAALTAIFAVGLGRMVLSDKLILTLVGQTLTQAAVVLLVVTRNLFRN